MCKTHTHREVCQEFQMVGRRFTKLTNNKHDTRNGPCLVCRRPGVDVTFWSLGANSSGCLMMFVCLGLGGLFDRGW